MYKFFLFFALLSSIESVVFECKYSNAGANGSIPAPTYYCEVKVIYTGDFGIVTSVTGNHLAGKNHDSVSVLSIRNQNVPRLPRGSEKCFGNILTINLINVELEVISQDDISQHKKLKQLYAVQNKIQTIDANLFHKNPLIFAVWFNDNPIEHIDFDAFKSLNSLTVLRFANTRQ